MLALYLYALLSLRWGLSFNASLQAASMTGKRKLLSLATVEKSCLRGFHPNHTHTHVCIILYMDILYPYKATYACRVISGSKCALLFASTV